MDEEAIRQREIFCRVEPQNFLRGRDLIAAGSSRVGRGGTAHGGHGMPDSGTQLDKNWTAGLRCLREYAPNFLDRKSTRLNSSHVAISYAVFCLKKKNKYTRIELSITPHLLRLN